MGKKDALHEDPGALLLQERREPDSNTVFRRVAFSRAQGSTNREVPLHFEKRLRYDFPASVSSASTMRALFRRFTPMILALLLLAMTFPLAYRVRKRAELPGVNPAAD